MNRIGFMIRVIRGKYIRPFLNFPRPKHPFNIRQLFSQRRLTIFDGGNLCQSELNV